MLSNQQSESLLKSETNNLLGFEGLRPLKLTVGRCQELMLMSTQNSWVKPNPQYDGVWKCGLWKVLCSDDVMRV